MAYKKGYKQSEEEKRMRSERMKGKNNPFYGKKHTEETKKKMVTNHQGTTGKHWNLSDETKKKISLVSKGRHLSKESIQKGIETRKNNGYICSDETKQKIGNANRNKHHTDESKKKLRAKAKLQFKNGMPEETKRKISEGNKGRIVSEETRRKIGEAQIGEKNNAYGKKHTIEQKQKMRIAKINYIQDCLNNGIPIFPSIGKNETKLLNQMEELFELKILRQYFIKELGYWVDGYIPELNLVFEVDERNHFERDGKLKERDIERQKIIEDKLGCKFLRIKDYD